VAASLWINDLNTRDLDGALAFYGSVFGWQNLDVGGGSMWALPGYGDFLEQRTPGLRENMPRWAPRSDSRAWSQASTRSPTTSRCHLALGCDVRRR